MKYLRNTKTLVAIIAALVLVPCLVRLAAGPSLRQRTHVQQARLYCDAGRIYAARAEYLAALERDPLNVTLHDEYLNAEIQHEKIDGDLVAYLDSTAKRYAKLVDRRTAELKAMLPPQETTGEDNAKEPTLPPDRELAVYQYCTGFLVFENYVATGNPAFQNFGYGLLRRSMDNDPQDCRILARLAAIHLYSPSRETFEWGENDLKAVITREPSRASNYETLFAYYARMGHGDEALALVPGARANTGEARLLAEEAAKARLKNFNLFAAAGEYLRAKLGAPSALLTLALAAIAAAAWVAAMLRQTAVRVPPIKILLAIGVGALGAALALVCNQLLEGSFGNAHTTARGWLVFENALRAGLIGELAKFLAILVLVWKAARARSVVEGVILGATVGGVFATVDAVLAARDFGAAAVSGRLFVTAAMEVCGGAIAGYFAAREIVRPSERPLTALAGMLIATAFHAAFTVADQIDASVAHGAFLIIAAEALLALWLLVRARGAGEWPGRLDARGARRDTAILLGLGLAIAFAAHFAILAADFRSVGEIAHMGLPHLLRAGFVAAAFCLFARRGLSAAAGARRIRAR